MTPTVAVRGEITREVPPEIATVRVHVAGNNRDRATALELLVSRSAALGTLLDEYSAAIERRESSGVYVYPVTKGVGERVMGYKGSVGVEITVADFSVLGDLVLRLAEQEQATVHGPDWALRPDSPVYRQARHDAIGDALTRAREYAEALGSRVVSLIELADTGLATHDAVAAGGGYGMQTMSARGGGGPTLELEPQRQWVHASIEARFAITDPPGIGG